MLTFGFHKFSLIDSMVNLKGVQPSTAALKKRDSQIKKTPPQKWTRKSSQILLSPPPPPEKTKISTRIYRNKSVKEASLQTYLNFVEQNKQQSINHKKDLQKLINDFGDYIHEIQNEFKVKQPKMINFPTSSNIEVKFKKITYNDNSIISEPSTYRKASIFNSDSKLLLYQAKNELNIQELQEQVKDFSCKLELLKKTWQNDQRVEKFLRQKTLLKQELKMLLFPTPEETNINLTNLQFAKLFKYRDQKYGFDRYHFVAANQLKDITDLISRVLEQKKEHELVEIRNSIQDQQKAIKLLEQSEIVKRFHIKKSFDYMSYESPIMQNTNKDVMLEKLERLHGNLIHVSSQNRRMNQAINSTILSLK